MEPVPKKEIPVIDRLRKRVDSPKAVVAFNLGSEARSCATDGIPKESRLRKEITMPMPVAQFLLTLKIARFSASSAVMKVWAARLWQSMQSITRRSPWGTVAPKAEAA